MAGAPWTGATKAAETRIAAKAKPPRESQGERVPSMLPPRGWEPPAGGRIGCAQGYAVRRCAGRGLSRGKEPGRGDWLRGPMKPFSTGDSHRPQSVPGAPLFAVGG